MTIFDLNRWGYYSTVFSPGQPSRAVDFSAKKPDGFWADTGYCVRPEPSPRFFVYSPEVCGILQAGEPGRLSSDRRKIFAEFAALRQIKFKSFSVWACTWQKIPLRLRSVPVVRQRRTREALIKSARADAERFCLEKYCMYFPLFELHGCGKRSGIPPKTIYSEVPKECMKLTCKNLSESPKGAFRQPQESRGGSPAVRVKPPRLR